MHSKEFKERIHSVWFSIAILAYFVSENWLVIVDHEFIRCILVPS